MSELQPPLVTVITVSFNHADYVAESLRSVIAQDYEAIEYVVIDDGSTDSSAQIIESFRDICARRFRHFVFVQQLNAGSVGRRCGVACDLPVAGRAEERSEHQPGCAG